MPTADPNQFQQPLDDMLNELYQIGGLPPTSQAKSSTGSGVFRPLYGTAWRTAMEQASAWMQARDLTVRRDAVGNLFGRLDAQEAGPQAVVATGSHIDTVRGGGKFDGALGVVGGILAVDYLRRTHGPPRRPLEVLVTCEEEGSRFRTHFWGARALVGQIKAGEAASHLDYDDVSLAEAMRQEGYDPHQIHGAARDDIGWFVELHPEQGAVLEQSGLDIGNVTAITGLTHREVTVGGRADHAGTTPMRLRCDALAGAALMIGAVEETARQVGEPAVATVGRLRVWPEQINVVPERVVFTVDMRHVEPRAQRDLAEKVEARLRDIAAARALDLRIEPLQDNPPVPMHGDVIEAVAAAATALGVSQRRMASGAGHDAQILAQRARAGMIFVPSAGGRSHSPAEFTAAADAARGVAVLAETLRRLAY